MKRKRAAIAATLLHRGLQVIEVDREWPRYTLVHDCGSFGNSATGAERIDEVEVVKEVDYKINVEVGFI